MNSFKINFNQIRLNPSFSEMMSALERGFTKFEIDFYLVGAIARDIWMLAINGMPPRRTTRDIDFAVLINDKGTFDALKLYLIDLEGFNEYKENPFVLLWKDGTQIDLLPFGIIEEDEGQITISETAFTTIQMPGFKEVYEVGLSEVELENHYQFKLCTLPSIVILKLIAWDDRPEARKDDIKDISDILKHYFSMSENEIFDKHNDLFEDENDNLLHIGARVMGRQMNKIAIRNHKLYTRLLNILTINTANSTNSKLADKMAEYFNNTTEENITLLQVLKKGFVE